MMHDKDEGGTIDKDECMEILFRRFGKEQLEERTNEFFKHDSDGDNNISFHEFQKQMSSIRPGKGWEPRALSSVASAKSPAVSSPARRS